MIKRLGGTTIKVLRKVDDYTLRLAEAACKDNSIAKARLSEMNIHSTEWYALGCTCEHIMHNDGTISDLLMMMDVVLEQVEQVEQVKELNAEKSNDEVNKMDHNNI